MADLRPDRDARTWAALAHVGGFGFVLFGFGHIILPLLIWLFKGDAHPFVEDQARESLNFQISISLYVLIAGVLFCLGVGWIIAAILGIVDIILIIIAAMRANAGLRYRYPITIRFV